MTESAPREWRLWTQQVLALLGFELRRTLLSKRSVLLYGGVGLALFPPILGVLLKPAAHALTVSDAAQFFVAYFHMMLLRMMIFFGSWWIFMNLFRAEFLDRTMHNYFLAPLSRKVLVVGKFISGWLAGVLVFSAALAAVHILAFWHAGWSAVMGAVPQLISYWGVMLLAVAGYGAVFLLAGLLMKNAWIPAVAIWSWELVNPFLPNFLKQISIIHYLNALLPIPPLSKNLGVFAEPVPILFGIAGPLLLAGILLTLAAWRIQRVEIHYGAE